MALAIGAALMALSGCVGGGFDLFGEKVDRSIATNTVAGAAANGTLTDEQTVGNTVASADISKLENGAVPWANTSTGSAGVITSIQENRKDGGLCRQFRTTRHSYQGIANFDGKICVNSGGNWQLLEFKKAG